MLGGGIGVEQRPTGVLRQSLALGLAGGDHDAALLRESAVDLLGGDNGTDLGHRLLGRLVRTHHLGVAVLETVGRRAAGDSRRHPPAVSARRPIARDLAFDHRHPQVGLERLR